MLYEGLLRGENEHTCERYVQTPHLNVHGNMRQRVNHRDAAVKPEYPLFAAAVEQSAPALFAVMGSMVPQRDVNLNLNNGNLTSTGRISAAAFLCDILGIPL